jgi:hypothetical protein
VPIAAGRSPLTATLVALAAINLGFGVWRSLQPARLSDFTQVTEWVRYWMTMRDPYGPGSVVDYPPWALALLAPFGVLPESWQAPIWIAINIGLAVTIAVHMARLTGEPRQLHVRLAALFLTIGAFRTLNQFSLFAFALALAGATLHWRTAGGLILGLGLLKPQVGGPVVLWALLSGQFRRTLVALTVPFIVTMFFADAIDSTMVTILREYRTVLASIYAHDIPFTGHTDLKGLAVSLWPALPGGFWFSISIAALLVTPAVVAVVRHRRPLDRSLELLAFCGVVSLLAVRHLSYDLVLVLPALAVWCIAPFSNQRRDFTIAMLFLFMIAWLVFDPAAVARRVSTYASGLAPLAAHVDRVFALILWGVLSVRLMKGRHGVARTS